MTGLNSPHHFEPISPEVALTFVQYAGGFATTLLSRLHNHENIDAQERAWLVCNTTGSLDPVAMCHQLIDAYNLHCITARLKT